MADTDKTVAYGVSADPSAFEQGMNKASAAAKDSATQIENSFKKVHDVFGTVQKALLGLTAIIAGGGTFKALISQAADWNTEAGKMAKTLGISSEQASVLNVALKHLGIDSDTYTSASVKMSKQIFSNAGAFETLGVAVKDSTGAYRPVTTVMAEVNTKLAEIKNPIEQNIAGMQVYGRSWQEIRSTLKLTSAVMDEAEIRARQLGLVVGTEGVAAAKQYKEQMRDLGLVSTSLSIQFGNQLLPVFTQLGRFMADEGPAAGQVFGTMLKAVAFGAAAGWLALKDMGDAIGAFAAQTAALLSGDIAGSQSIGRERDAQAAKNEAAFEKMKARFAEPLPPPTLAAADDKKGPHYNFKPEKEKGGAAAEATSLTSAWETKLTEEKLHFQERMNLENSFAQYSKADEIKFWQDRLALTTAGSNDNLAVRRKLADLGLAIGQEAYQHELASLQAKEGVYKADMTAKLAVLDQEAVLVRQRYGVESKEYEAVQKKMVEAKHLATDQLKQIDMQRAQGARDADLAELQGREQVAQLELQMGLISQADMLVQLRQFEEQKHAIALAALAERQRIALADPDKNIVELNRIHLEIEQSERAHQLALGHIRKQSTLESNKVMLDGINAMNSGFQNVFKQALQGQLTLKGIMQGLWQAMTNAVSSALATIAAKWVTTKITEMIFGKTAATAEISANAGIAGSAAVASTAAIPIIGPAMAPAAGAAAAAAAMAFQSLAKAPGFAVGSWDVPRDMVTKIHQGEMIVPAQFAANVREGGALGGGGGEDRNVNVQIAAHPMPGNYFMVHQSQLVAALKKANRNMAFS
jgi:hypothetical protein